MVNADGHDDVDDGDEDGQGSKNCGSCNPTLENIAKGTTAPGVDCFTE